MKYSKQREHILNVLRENAIHPTADEVCALARKDMPALSLARSEERRVGKECP